MTAALTGHVIRVKNARKQAKNKTRKEEINAKPAPGPIYA
jgi:hypothetical protein